MLCGNWKFGERGAATVELAIVLPLLVLLILGGTDTVMAIMTAQRMLYGVQLGAFCYAIKDQRCIDNGPVQWVQLRTEMPTGGLSFDPGATCGVAGTWNYTFTPLLLPKIPITTTACFPCHPYMASGYHPC